MKFKIQFSIIFLLFTISDILFAQSTFQKTYSTPGGATCKASCFTSDGNYVFATYSTDSGLEGIYLIKITEVGDTIWTVKYQTPGMFIAPKSIIEDSNSNLVLTGTANDTITSDTDAFIMKVDSSGILQWIHLVNNISAVGGSNDSGYEVLSTPDSGYVLLGNCKSTMANAGDAAFVMKFDRYGNLFWNYSYQFNYEIEGRCIQHATDGDYVICGTRTSPGIGAGKIYILRINEIGYMQWSKIISGPGLPYGEADYIRQTSDNGYIVAGRDSGSNKIFLLKTDSVGNFSWMKTYDTPYKDNVYSLELTQDSGYVMVGGTDNSGNSDYFLIKTNSVGDTLFTKHYGTVDNEVPCSVHQTSDGGYFIGGFSNQSTYIVKTDSVGNSVCNMPLIPFSVNDVIQNSLSGLLIQIDLNWTITNPNMVVASGGTVTTLCPIVGLHQYPLDRTFLIAPNPSNGNFSITFLHTISEAAIEFYDVFGKRIFTEKIFNGSKKEIVLSNISKGIYLVKVFDGEKSVYQKIIVE